MRILTEAGETIVIGTTEAEPTIGIVDYSRRTTDAFGVTTVVKRNFSRRMSVRVAVPSDQVDVLQRRLAALRATPVTWIADDRFASLTVRGFFKDLEFDLAVPPLSFCTLTIESIAGGDVPADPGGDPAPAGIPSTLQLLQPLAITDAALASSSVAENDAPAWVATTTYPKGARVISAARHRIYESLVAGNKANDPAEAGGMWLDLGPTNRWAMFDAALGTSTSSAASIVVRINAGADNAVALLDVKGATVRVQATGYDRTQPVGEAAITFLDLPANPGQITVTIAGTGTKSVGTLLVGRLVALGVTEASPTAGITDYSRKEVDDFGEVTIVERPFAKRMAARALIDTTGVNLVANRLAAVRARPCLWTGQAGLDSLTIYGFFKDFSISVGPTVSKLSLSIEGLSTAGELKPLGSAVNWPDIADPDGTKPAPNADKTSENVAKDTAAVGGKPAAEVVYAIGDLYEALGTTESAQQYADAAQGAATAADTARAQSQAARDAAQAAQALAVDARGGAEAARNLANTARNEAESARTAAQTALGQTTTAKGAAETARDAAKVAQTGAETALGLTNTAKTAAEQANTNAQAALTGATNARADAIAKAGEAATSATNADGSAKSAAGHATTATQQAGLAANSATAAAGSAVTAASAQRDAETSADAAASSASSASTSATNAGTSASAANQSKLDAATEAGKASASATNAASSATNAAGSASTATTQAGLAAGSATAAGGSASAAAGSATTAGTKATEAGNSATVAQGASISAASARDAAQAANKTIFRSDFKSSADDYWIANYIHSKDQLLTLNGPVAGYSAASIVTEPGAGAVLQATNGDYVIFSERATRPFIQGQKIRLRVRTRLTADVTSGNHTHYSWITSHKADGSYCGYTGIYTWSRLTVADGWVVRDIVFEPWVLRQNASTLADAVEWRLMLSLNAASTRNLGAIQQIDTIQLDDVTSEQAASGFATAASTSASNAATSATNAGTSATAASGSANTAATKAGEALTYSNNAATSASNAAGSSNTASQQAAVSASNATATRLAMQATFPEAINGDLVTSASLGGASAALPPVSATYPSWVVDNGAAIMPAKGIYTLGLIAPLTMAPGQTYEAVMDVENVGAIPANTRFYYVGMDTSLVRNSAWDATSGTWTTLQPNERTTIRRRFSYDAPAAAGVTAIPVGGSVMRLQPQINRVASGSAGEPEAQMKVRSLYIRNITAEKNASDAASAAALSASAASTSATDAGTSATSATTAANTATTKAGEASSSAGSAATSATNASGSANAAASSATVSANSRDAAQAAAKAVGPSIFFAATTDPFWTVSGFTGENDATAGAYVLTNTSSGTTYGSVVGRALQPSSAERTWKIRARVKSSRVGLILLRLQGYAINGTSGAGNTDLNVSIPVANQWVWVEGELASPASAAFVAQGAFPNYPDRVNGAVTSIAALELLDVTSEVAARSSASAAATSANTAATQATNAGTSATAASTAANTATTKAGEANSAATRAATSETNALGSANSASASATVSATSAGQALGQASLLFPDRMTANGDYFFDNTYLGDPAAVAMTAAGKAKMLNQAGYGWVYNAALTGREYFAARGVFPVVLTDTYEIEVEYEVVTFSGTNSTFNVWSISLGPTYGQQGSNLSTGWTVNATGVFTRVFRIGATSAPGVSHINWVPDGSFVRPMVGSSSGFAGSDVRIRRVSVRNITQKIIAETAAAAAATSASTAGTKATEAGVSANAASTSATTASTKAGEANTYANNASNSATSAAGSATTATQQAGVATTASSAATAASEAARLALADTYPVNINAGVLNSSGPTGAPSTLPSIAAQYPAWVTDNGSSITPAVGWSQIALIAPVNLTDGEVYEVTAHVTNVGPVAARAAAYYRHLNADYSQYGLSIGSGINLAPGESGIVKHRFGRGISAAQGLNINAAANSTRVLLLTNRVVDSTSIQSNAQMKVTAFYVRNVTAETKAAESASAAAGSASAASTSATNAGQSATAAAASATNAETARGQASTFASQASTSATNAAGSANAASQSAGVAAVARDAATNVASGNLVQKSIFDDGTIGGWSIALSTVVDSGPASLPRVRVALMGQPNDYAEGDYRPTSPGRILEVSGWVKAPSTTAGPGFGIQERNVSGTASLRHVPVTVTAVNTWIQFSHKMTVSATGVEWRPFARQSANGGVRFTDLVIRDVTERDAAQTAATAAATSESNAAASKTGADSAASAANTAKVAAETARGQAQTAATNAATSETNALGSKNAAAASATVAASTAADIVTMDGNFLFNQGTAGWAPSAAAADIKQATTAFTFAPAYSGASNVLITGAGRSDLLSWNKFSVQPGRTYKLSARFGISVTSGTVQMYLGVQTYGANGASIGTNNGYAYILVPGTQFGAGWVEREVTFTTASLTAGTTDVRLLAFTNYNNNATGSLGFDYFILEDITESAAANSSALAAATSASAAATSKTDAGTSASAANQSRIDAQTANNNAQQAATTATTAAATSTAAAASAQTSATVASRFGGQSLNRNGSFQEPDATWVYSSTVNYKLPLGWSSWAREGSGYLAPSSMSNAYGPQAPLQIDRAGTGLASGVVQTIPFMAKGWYVLEADVTLEDGLHTGAGMYVDFGGTAGNARLHFGSDVDLAEEVSTGGMGSVNRKFSKLVYCAAMATNVRLYLMASWNTFGGNTGFLRTIWHKGHIRPAAQGEIDGNKARYDSGVNAARIEQVNTTLTNNLGSLATQTNTLTARFEETPRTYIIRSAGLGASNTGKLSGLFNGKDERIGAVPSRSYRVFVKQPNNDTWATQNFDIQGGGQTAINAMVGYLNGIGTGQVVVVVTADEPEANRTNGNLITALRRVGAGPLYTSPDFVYRGAYALVGRAGLGPGNGLEWLAGSASGAADAWIEESFSLIGNRIVGAGAGKAIESKVAQEAAALATATSAVAQRASNLESRAGNLESKTSITEQTVADLKSGAASARLELLAAAPGGRAKMTIRSDATSAGIDLEGDVNFSGKVIFNNGTVMFVQGLGFGSTGQFLEWLGPSKANLNQCTEAEAIRYVKMDGSAYFRGTFLAGSLRSSTANPGVGQNVTADTGLISSNGGGIVVQGSWDYTWTQVLEFPATTQGIQNFDGAAAANGATDRGNNNWQGMQTPSLGNNSLAIQKDGTTVASVSTTTGSRMTSGWRPIAGDSPGRLTVTTTMALSTTYSDPERSTRQRAFRAVLTRGYLNVPTSQFVGITTVE